MHIERFRIAEGTKVNLKDHPTDYSDDYLDKKSAEKDLGKNVARLAELQDVLYAQNIHSLLIVFQAMDAAGKDGAIEHVMSGVNPQGCHVVSFKAPRRKSLTTIICGDVPETYLNAERSGSSTVRITKKCWSFVFTRKYFRVSRSLTR